MSCTTPACQSVEAGVRQWMDSHQAEAQAIGLWNVFDDAESLDVVISVQLADGKRQKHLPGGQAVSVTLAIKDEIIHWLERLSTEPAVA